MAQFDYSGIDEAIRQLAKADLFTDENIKELLSVGADVLLDEVQSAYIQSVQSRTGQTRRHIVRARKVAREKDGTPYMYVTINGKDSRGQRYGAKGFVLNYGRARRYGEIPAKYYWTNAVSHATQRAVDKMADQAAEILKR